MQHHGAHAQPQNKFAVSVYVQPMCMCTRRRGRPDLAEGHRRQQDVQGFLFDPGMLACMSLVHEHEAHVC